MNSLPRSVALRGLLFVALLAGVVGPSAVADQEPAPPEAPAPRSAAPQRLLVHEAVQLEGEMPAVRVYFDLLDAAGEEVDGVTAEDVAATLGEEPLALDPPGRFTATGEGVAYVFLVDVSKSVGPDLFDRIRAALGAWFAELVPADRAAIVAFGDESRVVVDFTADRDRLAAALAGLGPTDDRTLLHRALLDAFELGARRDPGLPSRRAAVVLTDGRDEGSGLTADDVVAAARGVPTPIYAIGYSQLAEPRRREGLDALHRFASNSGGAFFAADRAGIEHAYGEIRRAVTRGWVVEARCPGCRADGAVYRLQLTVRRGGRVLSQGTDLRLLPPAVAGGEREAGPASSNEPIEPSRSAGSEASAGTESAARSASAGGGASSEQGAPSSGDGGSSQARLWTLSALVAVIVVLAGTLGWLLRRRSAAAGRAAREEVDRLFTAPPPPPAPSPPSPKFRPSAPPLPSAGALSAAAAAGAVRPPAPFRSRRPATRPPASTATDSVAPEPPRRVRFVVLRGSRRGREYAVTLEQSAVVGARSTCDLVLAEERSLAPRQFELLQRDRRVMIRNLAESTPTLLNGLAVDDWQPLKSNDLVGTGETILRVVYQ